MQEKIAVVSSKQMSQGMSILIYTVVGAGALLIGGLGGFLGGVQYQKGQVKNVASASVSRSGVGFTGRGSFSGARLGSIGTVSAISSTSITITVQPRGYPNSSSSMSKTYAITSKTTVTSGGANSTTSVIAVGDMVRIRASSSDASTAASIDIGSSSSGSSNTSGTGSTDSSSSISD